MAMRLGTWNVRSRFVENGSKGVREDKLDLVGLW
jgi:hypothetical protein